MNHVLTSVPRGVVGSLKNHHLVVEGIDSD